MLMLGVNREHEIGTCISSHASVGTLLKNCKGWLEALTIEKNCRRERCLGGGLYPTKTRFFKCLAKVMILYRTMNTLKEPFYCMVKLFFFNDEKKKIVMSQRPFLLRVHTF